LVECFDSARNTCRLDGHCRLKAALREAMNRYMEVLDGVTLADLVAPSAGANRSHRLQFMPGRPPLP
jgi:Rrf2 family nitric oxide-sensitive transcriptional repressor